MKKNKIIVIGLIGLILIAVALYAAFHTAKTIVGGPGISGTVTNVVNKPNQAEDGFYGIEVRDSNGRQYTINATGYLNTPISPASQGKACVSAPKVKTGDKVSFNLPKSESQQDTFVICYKKNLSGYYLRVEQAIQDLVP